MATARILLQIAMKLNKGQSYEIFSFTLFFSFVACKDDTALSPFQGYWVNEDDYKLIQQGEYDRVETHNIYKVDAAGKVYYAISSEKPEDPMVFEKDSYEKYNSNGSISYEFNDAFKQYVQESHYNDPNVDPRSVFEEESKDLKNAKLQLTNENEITLSYDDGTYSVVYKNKKITEEQALMALANHERTPAKNPSPFTGYFVEKDQQQNIANQDLAAVSAQKLIAINEHGARLNKIRYNSGSRFWWTSYSPFYVNEDGSVEVVGNGKFFSYLNDLMTDLDPEMKSEDVYMAMPEKLKIAREDAAKIRYEINGDELTRYHMGQVDKVYIRVTELVADKIMSQ
tara:strand:+ start:982 stop:2004 length:1023 start_codon:yes stop_codon:yes gene_type:complete